jgi:hypothetical protein
MVEYEATPNGTRVGLPISDTKSKLKGRESEGQRPFMERTLKQEFARDRNQWEFVLRIVDRAARTYVEQYHDRTGKVVFSKEGPLDDQGLHGPRGRSPG